MQQSDFEKFSQAWGGAWETVGRNVTARAIVTAFELLRGYPIRDIERALQNHVMSDRGREPPRPADIREILEVQGTDGHPGPEAAWGMIAGIVANERETVMLTDEMREAWAACAAIMSLGDEVGARRCFLEVYVQAVQLSRAERRRPAWTPTLGTDPDRRRIAIEAAITRGQLTSGHATRFLPGPSLGISHAVAILTHTHDDSGEMPEDAEQARRNSALSNLAAIKANLGATRAATKPEESPKGRQWREQREAEERRRLDRLREAEVELAGREEIVSCVR